MASTSGSGSRAPRPPRAAGGTPSSSIGASSATTPTLSVIPTTTPSGTPSSSAEAQPAAAQPEQGIDRVVIDDEDDVPFVKKRKLKSDVWLDFEQVTVNGRTRAECKWCKKTLAGDGRAGTTHLRNHIASCQSRQVRKGLKQSTLKLGKDKNGAVLLDKYVFDKQVARKELALMICLHEYPLSMVDHAGFRRFCAAMQPLFKVMSRNTIKKDILDMYEVQRRSMLNFFQQCQSRIAVTTDMWTANHQKKGYMSVTVHFIDNDWKLKSFLLRFIYVPAPHTGEVISDVLYEVLQDWQIQKKISTVTLDNCSSNDTLMNTMQDKLPLSSLMLHGKLLHMRCAAHIINLIVKDGMAVMDEGIERVRDSVGFWCATPKRHERFERTAAQMNVKYDRRIALDCKTRWNSTYIMLSTALEYQSVFDRLASKEKLCAPFKPTEDDWIFARELCGRLKMFFDATELLSGSNYVTANLFFPKICGIYLAIEKWKTSGIPKVEEMSALMKDKFTKYWTDVHGLMEIATVLDPRYKLIFMKAFYRTIYGEEATDIEVSRVKSLLYELVLEYQDFMEGMATTDALGAANRNVALNEGDDLMFGIFDKFLSEKPEESSTYLRTELDLYLEEPTLPRTQELDIISWWQYAGIKYPTLRRIARDIMAIPVTTVASESVFSTGGRVISPHRSRLAPKTVEGLMCMQAWSRADMLGDQSGFMNALMTCLEDEEEEMDDPDSTIID